MIYFLAHAGTNRVKIGYTRHSAASRIAQITPYSPVPLELIATAPGGPGVEPALHREFADLRLHNEWFRLEGPLRDLVRQLITDGPGALAEYLELSATESAYAHGTISNYVNHKCRCPDCKAAATNYQAAHRRQLADECAGCSGECPVLWRPGNRGRPPQCAECRARVAQLPR